MAQAYARGGVKALAERVDAEAATLLAAPWRRTAPVFDAEGELDARVAAQVRRALRELASAADRAAARARRAGGDARCPGGLRRLAVGRRARHGHQAAVAARPARARALLPRPPGGCLPGPDQARAVPRRRRAPRDQRRFGPAAAPPRGRAARRAPVLLCRGLATDRAARAELARGGRRRRAVGPLAAGRRRRRPAHRGLGRAPAPPRARRRRLGGRGGVCRADRARGRALRGRRGAARPAGAHRPPSRARRAGPAARAPHLVGVAAGGLGLVPGASGSSSATCGRRRSCPTPSR